MNISGLFSNIEQERLHWGDGLGLWDVCRNKIIGLPTVAIFYNQANDKDLKRLVQFGCEHIIIPHIESIQTLLKSENLGCPEEPNIKNKFKSLPESIKPNTLIQDDEIAVSLRELTRLTLTLESEALRNATRADVRQLLSKIFEDDNNAYNQIVKLQKDKSWDDMPPYLH